MVWLVRIPALGGDVAIGYHCCMSRTLLIDSIVRQTTVLIASLATAAGHRPSLAHVANQVLANLVTELKSQGLGNKVIADMFGMALRTYHDRVARLAESQSEVGRSLWDAVLSYVENHDVVLRADVLRRFNRDGDAMGLPARFKP